ncbi:MAG: sodium:proton antiporter [Planctomycetia bacterium]
MSLLWTLPFAGMLASIALFPLFAGHFWHHHFPKVALGWIALVVPPFLFFYGAEAFAKIVHILVVDYVPFMILLASLYTISGGVLLRGTLVGTPWTNAGLMLFGTALASWIGTTGASMLLIRPLLRANATRKYNVHTVVFFIFLVSNIGGCLTPLGDPPLFLGYLHHVPFFWTLENLWPHLLVCGGLVLAAYTLLDLYYYRLEPPVENAVPAAREPLAVEGLQNLPLMAGVIAGVLVSGSWKPHDLNIAGFVEHGEIHLAGLHLPLQNLARDLILLAMLGLSLVVTPKPIRAANGFTWFPMKEVGWLFLAIFVTIIPTLEILNAGKAGALRPLIDFTTTPAHYFWVTGLLSSLLDNAPTYYTFLTTLRGAYHPGMAEDEAVARLVAEHGIYLAAISLGAVFMGANTYIGNAPNFMVKSIAEEAGVKMPDFFSYIFKYSLPFLGIPFVIVTVLFFWK